MDIGLDCIGSHKNWSDQIGGLYRLSDSEYKLHGM